MTELQNNLPAGWDAKLDARTGKTYYINHHLKTTTWEDPRSRHRIHGTPTYTQYEYIPLQHGTPDTRRNYVYPSQTSPKPAFQMSAHYSPKYIPLQDLKSSPRTTSPLLLQTTQESSLTNVSETDEAVSKISSMFPTVSNTHIRLLLKKYMKSIFPKAEETVILDVLTSNDNHIQKASDCLKQMGYERRDPVKLLQEQQKREEEAKFQEEKRLEAIDNINAPHVPVVKSAEEKRAIQTRLQQQYVDVSGEVITIALDSVQYDEARANQILQIMVQEDTKKIETNDDEKNDTTDGKEEKLDTLTVNVIPISQSRQSFKSLLISEKADVTNKSNNFGVVFEGNEYSHATLAKGPNEKLLLADYITWQGPNSELRNGPQKSLVKGPNKANLSGKYYTARGPNSELCKGPKSGLAKGSMFKQFRNIVIGESRGK